MLIPGMNRFVACWAVSNSSGGSKGGMKVGGVKEISPNIVESTIQVL